MKCSITFAAALATPPAYPVGADVCVDFHAAVAIERAAGEAKLSNFREHSPSVSDSDLEGRAKLKVQESLIRAHNVASEVVQKAEMLGARSTLRGVVQSECSDGNLFRLAHPHGRRTMKR